MASLLTVASKIPNPREWDQVCDSIGSGLGNNPNVKDMRTILSLSYYNLPSHLRTCLLYLGIYPEDYEIPRDDLIWKWIAEGLSKTIRMAVAYLRLEKVTFMSL